MTTKEPIKELNENRKENVLFKDLRNKWIAVFSVIVIIITVFFFISNSFSSAAAVDKINKAYKQEMNECLVAAEYDIESQMNYLSKTDKVILEHKWAQLKHDAKTLSFVDVDVKYGGKHGFCVEVWELTKPNYVTYHDPYYPYPMPRPVPFYGDVEVERNFDSPVTNAPMPDSYSQPGDNSVHDFSGLIEEFLPYMEDIDLYENMLKQSGSIESHDGVEDTLMRN